MNKTVIKIKTARRPERSEGSPVLNARVSSWRFLAALGMTLLLVFSGNVGAQATSASSRRDAPNDRREPVHPPRDDTSPAELMRRHNGSLLRAALSTPNPSTPALTSGDPLEAASYFYVPAPEPRVVRKHDLITIIIREESQAKTNAKTDLSRDSEIDARVEEFLRVSGFKLTGGGVSDPIPSIKASAERNFQGNGKIDRTDSFTARIQAEVIDVKPNGTLVLQARKRIMTDDEEQTFVLSGVCRAEDVTADNSVLSTQLYDLELHKKTKGAVRDSTRRGAVHRFFDWLNPF
jgi:flagellar L-ring protein FlgH